MPPAPSARSDSPDTRGIFLYFGPLALVGQEQLMSGRLSALWQIVLTVPYVLGAFASGYIAEHVSPRNTFIIVAVLTLLIAAFGLWKPVSVFRNAYDKTLAKGTDFLG